jgi:hypothetical protein
MLDGARRLLNAPALDKERKAQAWNFSAGAARRLLRLDGSRAK